MVYYSKTKFSLLTSSVVLLLIRLIDNKATVLRRKYIKKQFDIEIGKYTYGYKIKNIEKGTKIGAFCSIADGVKIGLINHPIDCVSTNPFLCFKTQGFLNDDLEIPLDGHVIIKDDVWIGANSIIMPNIVIEKGAVIGAGSVVTKDVMPYEIVAGNPAKHINWRVNDPSDPSLRKKLYSIDWCSWDDKKIKNEIKYFYNIKSFVNKFNK